MRSGTVTDMRNTIRNYRALRNAQVRNAWRVSGVGRIARDAGKLAAGVAIVGMVLYLISDKANAVATAADNRVAASIAKQAEYIKELETTLAKCLSRTDQPIWIGDELSFCSASDTGIKR